jgi:hypothetical protein
VKLELRDIKEVEAVAKVRIHKVEGKKPIYVAVLTSIAIGASYLLQSYSQIGAIALAIIGIAVFYFYMDSVDKKVKAVAGKLVKEWQEAK